MSGGHVESCGQVEGIEAVIGVLDAVQPDVVVSEGFRLYPWKKPGFDRIWSAEVQGAVMSWCGTRRVQYVEQPAALRGVADPIIRALKRQQKIGCKAHALDSLRHAVTYLWRYHPDLLTPAVRRYGEVVGLVDEV
jgi:hypothetical protein